MRILFEVLLLSILIGAVVLFYKILMPPPLNLGDC